MQGRKQQYGIAKVPITCNPVNVREVEPMAREITKRMVWWKGKKSLVSVL